MLIRKNIWIIFLFVFAVLSACSSDDKEFDTFLNEVEQDISGEDADPDKYIRISGNRIIVWKDNF